MRSSPSRREIAEALPGLLSLGDWLVGALFVAAATAIWLRAAATPLPPPENSPHSVGATTLVAAPPAPQPEVPPLPAPPPPSQPEESPREAPAAEPPPAAPELHYASVPPEAPGARASSDNVAASAVQALPAEEREQFERQVARGEKLVENGAPLPAYRSQDLDESFIERLVEERLACVILRAQGLEGTVLFEGAHRSPLRARLAREADQLPELYSERAVPLEAAAAQRFLQCFRRDFLALGDREQPRCLLLLAKDLDRAILADQAEAARREGVPLEDVLLTHGRILKHGAFPLRYEVTRVELKKREPGVPGKGGPR